MREEGYLKIYDWFVSVLACAEYFLSICFRNISYPARWIWNLVIIITYNMCSRFLKVSWTVKCGFHLSSDQKESLRELEGAGRTKDLEIFIGFLDFFFFLKYPLKITAMWLLEGANLFFYIFNYKMTKISLNITVYYGCCEGQVDHLPVHRP